MGIQDQCLDAIQFGKGQYALISRLICYQNKPSSIITSKGVGNDTTSDQDLFCLTFWRMWPIRLFFWCRDPNLTVVLHPNKIHDVINNIMTITLSP